jgi:hypothetical protein
LVGRLEKEMAWQAHDAARKARDSLMDARRRLMSAKKVEAADWSDLTEEDLLRKLMERKVIKLLQKDAESDERKPGRSMWCSDGFVGLCRRCLGAESEGYPSADASK